MPRRGDGPQGRQGRVARAFVPESRTLSALEAAASACEGCDLFERATQTVFGRGPGDAKLVVVGEQPGDEEDRTGEPFVGPAGRLLDRALHEAGIDRGRIYVTNAVKHFKWEPRGKRRLHSRPNTAEITACHPWLAAELGLVKPAVVVCLGATAAQSILGKTFRLTQSLGSIVDAEGWKVIATYHPSAVLRTREPQAREKMQAQLRADLKRAWRLSLTRR